MVELVITRTLREISVSDMIMVEHPYLLVIGVLLVSTYLFMLVRRIHVIRRILRKALYYEEGFLEKSFLYMKITTIIFLTIALSQPYVLIESEVNVDNPAVLDNLSGRFPANYIVLIDVSPSMHENGGLDKAIEAYEKIIQCLNTSDRLVIAVFGGEVVKIYEGDPYNATKVALIVPMYELNYTSISNALAWAQEYSRVTSLPSIVIVLSDGAHNYGGDPLIAVDVVNSSKIPLIFINTGNDPRGLSLYSRLASRGYKVLDASSLDEASLKNVLKNIVIETKYNAYRFRGESLKLTYFEKDYLPTIALIASAIVLYLFSRLEVV